MNLLCRVALVLLLFAPGVFGDPGESSAKTVAPHCVVLIGGIDSDPTPEQIEGVSPRGQGQSGLFQMASDLNETGVTAEYFNWNGTRAGKINEKPPLAAGIAQFIRVRHAEHPEERLAIVANSWGGHTAIEVCQALSAPEIPIG
jgi:hypothetical protein